MFAFRSEFIVTTKALQRILQTSSDKKLNFNLILVREALSVSKVREDST